MKRTTECDIRVWLYNLPWVPERLRAAMRQSLQRRLKYWAQMDAIVAGLESPEGRMALGQAMIDGARRHLLTATQR